MLHEKQEVNKKTMDAYTGMLAEDKKDEFRSRFLKIHTNDQFNIIRFFNKNE